MAKIAKCDKLFLSIFSKMPSETFFLKISRQNSVKASFMYNQRTATATVFLNKFIIIDSLILFSEHISRPAIPLFPAFPP